MAASSSSSARIVPLPVTIPQFEGRAKGGYYVQVPDAVLAPFKDWCTNLRRLDRLPKNKTIKLTTYETIRKDICGYFGFLDRRQKENRITLPNGFLSSLDPYLDGEFLASFISFLLKRRRRGNYMFRVLASARKVVAYLLEMDDSRVSKKYQTTLANYQRQVRRINTSPAGKFVIENPLGVAKTLIHCIEKKEREIKRKLRRASNPVSKPLARWMHDLLLIRMLFGWLPTSRSGELFLLKVAEDRSPCKETKCAGRRCPGNVLMRDGNSYAIKRVHHKTEKYLGEYTLTFPNDLVEDLRAYLANRRVLSSGPTLFFNKLGEQFTVSSFSHYIKRLVHTLVGNRLGVEDWDGLGPLDLRRIFVTVFSDMKERHSRALPKHVDVAFAIGNSVQEWRRSYDLRAKDRAARQGMMGMTIFRRSLQNVRV